MADKFDWRKVVLVDKNHTVRTCEPWSKFF